MTTTLSCLLQSAAEGEKIFAELAHRGIAAADLKFVEGTALEGQSLTDMLAAWDIEADAARHYADAIAGGSVLVLARVTDETHETAKAVMEGQSTESGGAHSKDRGNEADHLEADLTAITSPQ